MPNKVYSYGRQTIEDDDLRGVQETLKSIFLTQGPKVGEFEKAIAVKLGARNVTALCNGTAALHLAGLALGWKDGDIVITAPITFVASANCILYAGARPDLVDIESDFYTIDPNKLEEKLRSFAKAGRKVKAVVAIDYAGNPCDWSALRSLAKKYELQLVNDNCHALGAQYDDDIKYATRYADVACLSFHPVKHITTGEGGAALTNDDVLDARLKLLRTHGITKREDLLLQNDGPWYYEMQELGFNYRITDFQCALGVTQLRKVDRFLKERRESAEFYSRAFAGDERLVVPKVRANSAHAFHLYPLQIRFDKLRTTKKEFFEKMAERGIKCQVHYIPVHLQPYYRKRLGYTKGDYPVAEKFYEQEVSIPLYPGLLREDLEYIHRTILDVAV